MQAAITGISTIWVVIGVGWLVAHVGLVNRRGRRLVSMLAFTVASPPLLFGLVARASLDHVFAATAVVSVIAIGVMVALYLALARLFFRPDLSGLVIGAMASAYTNAGNFGLPVAMALLGDATWVAPIMLVQVGVLQPICLALLDVDAARTEGVRLSPGRYLSLPVRNPITVGILLGLAVNLLGVPVPAFVLQPVDMLGAMAVPLMLLAFGVSLRLDPKPGVGDHSAQVWVTVVLKLIVHPLVAWAIGRYGFGLGGHELYAVVILGALPAAQNMFVIATRYGRSELLARDSVFWTTIGSVGTLLVAAALLG